MRDKPQPSGNLLSTYYLLSSPNTPYTCVLRNYDVVRYFQRLFENPVAVLPSYWQSTYWFYGLWQLYNRTDYVRRHRPVLLLTVTGRALLRSRPTAYFVFTSLHAFQRRCHASKHWSNSFSNNPFSSVVTWLRICCEMCQSVALSNPYFCLFLNKNNFYTVNSGEWFGFSKDGVCCSPECNCREGYLGRRFILMYDEYLVLYIPKYEPRMLDGLFREVNVWL